MAVLVSPGVSVSIINESFYGGAGAGTIPLIIMATASNKTSPSGSGYAPYTLPSEAGKLFLATSQRELIQNYGNPSFYSVQGTQIHGYELNEYGLHAAYQYLGLANRAYVLRADIDLAQLVASDSAPKGPPVAGTYWLDLTETSFGLFQSNGNVVPGVAWEAKSVIAVTENYTVEVSGVKVPLNTVGTNGQFAVVVASTDNKFYEKIGGSWLEVNTAAWKAARPTTVRGVANPANVSVGQSIVINGITCTVAGAGTITDVVTAITNAAISNINATIVSNALVIRNTAGGNITISNGTGTPLTTLGITPGTYKGVTVTRTNDAQYPAASVAGDIWIKGASPNFGAKWSIKFYNAAQEQWTTLTAPLYPFNALLSDGDVNKDLAAFAGIGVPTTGNVYVGYDATQGVQQIRRWSGTRWEDLVYEASVEEPSTAPEDGTYWFNADFRVDVMVGDGQRWNGYRRRYPNTDPQGVIIAGSMPIAQSDGTPLVENDLWIDSSDLENYPALYRYNASMMKWRKVDLTDQTTPFGVIFADARQDSGVEFTGMPNEGAYTYNSEDLDDLLISDYVDPDAPDPRTHPDGMLLFNTRYSTYNVKVWRPNYFVDGDVTNGAHADPNTNYSQTTYTVGDPDYVFPALASTARWVTASGNRADGSPYMGRKAQRALIVKAMAAAIAQNEDLRSEIVYYNLMAAPGYPELMDELVQLNTEQKEFAFIVGDTPARLKPSGTTIQAWATNSRNVPSNGEDGLTTANTYCGVYYPWGLGRNVDGSEVMIPASTIALCTLAYNDSVAYPWFAPAGFTRGLVTVATSVGYLTDEGEYKPVLLNQGQRDVLYTNKINPIAFIPGRGLVVYGQKTLHPLQSALDRINVARLMNYLKFNLDNLMKPFLFEQNDQQTRDSAKLMVDRFLSNLITQRALEDFATLCDETNNTPERRDRNELWVDIAIKPLKAIEFIYVPIRVRNSADTLDI